MPPAPFSPRRAVLLGLCLSGLAGGLYVGVQGLRAPPDCAAWSDEQCLFERQLAARLAWRQRVAGGALALLGVAAGLGLRGGGGAAGGGAAGGGAAGGPRDGPGEPRA
jgi:hypothetical protein